MAGNVINATTINQAAAADAKYLEDVYYYIKARLNVVLTNYGNTTQLNGFGITNVNDQNEILGLQIDMQNIVALFEGMLTITQGSERSILQDIAVLRGN
jgi:hypothetical protein